MRDDTHEETLAGERSEDVAPELWPPLQDVLSFARPTGELVTVRVGSYEGPKKVKMERLSTDEPVKYSRGARDGEEVDLLVYTFTYYSESLVSRLCAWPRGHIRGERRVARSVGHFASIETCPVCGVTVIFDLRWSRRSDGPYPCSERCRSRLRRPDVDLTRSCERCGARFTPARKDAKTCSTRCRVALHRARNGSQPTPGEGPGSVTRIEGRAADAR